MRWPRKNCNRTNNCAKNRAKGVKYIIPFYFIPFEASKASATAFSKAELLPPR